MNVMRNIAALLLAAFVAIAPARADQSSLVTPGAPLTMGGLAAYLNASFATLGTCFSGSTAPTEYSGNVAKQYQCWADTSTSPTTMRFYDGTQWVAWGTLDTTAHAFAIPTSENVVPHAGTNYTFADPTDKGKLHTFSNASSIAVTLPQPGVGGAFTNGYCIDVQNLGAGTATFTPQGGAKIDNAGSRGFKTGQGGKICSDGTDYQLKRGWVAWAVDLADGLTGSGLVVMNNSPTLIAPALGVATATSLNGLTITSSTGTLTIANGKTLTANNSLTLSGTDGKALVLTNGLTVTTNDGTLAFGGASKTLTVNNSLSLSGTDGKTLTLTNGLTVTTNDGTLAFGAASKTLTINNSIALSGTDSTTMTMPGASDTLGGLATAQTWTKQNIHNVASTIASATGAALDDLKVSAATTTVTGNTGSPITRLAKVGLYQPTITDSSVVTVTDAATLYIDNAPVAGGSVTLSNSWAFLVGAGATKLQATTINGALTYGGVTLSNSVTGTGPMVLGTSPSIASPTFTGTVVGASTIPNSVLQNSTITVGSTSTSLGGTLSAATGRGSSGLNVDAFTGHGDSSYTILATDRTVGTNAAFTAARTWTLPAANAVNAGQEILVADYQGTVTGSNTLTIQRAGSDTINGAGTSVTISAANGAYLFRSDGTSKWTAQSTGAASAGGVSSVTCGATVITTSGTCFDNAAWTTFTPTIVCGVSGTIAGYTTQAGRYKILGKSVWFTVDLLASGAGTCSGSFNVGGLPFTSGAGRYEIPGYDISGGSISGDLQSGATQFVLATSTNGNVTVTHHVILTGVAETN